MKQLVTNVALLQPGDLIVAAGPQGSVGFEPPLEVLAIQRLGAATIVDLTDGTSTGPMPNHEVRVRRAGRSG